VHTAVAAAVESLMIYLFGDCALDTDRRELRRGSRLVEIEPQVFDLLEFLIRTRERVASREDLLEAVWRGRIVSESTLSSRINAARSAIGDDGAAQRLIRTLPRKGVRFVGDVSEQLAEAPEQASSSAATHADPAASAPTTDGPSIAVLPFTNMGGDVSSDYFADGMAEEIITALARCSGILVIARNSSFIYKGKSVDVREVGRELGVGYVLEGSVRRSGDQLRITAQLIETATGTHIWADRFDGSLQEAFDLQDRIASTAAAVIEPRLRFAEVQRVKRSPLRSLDAYDWWLRAVAQATEFTQPSMARALDDLDRAMQIDPDYALAMASAAYYRALCEFQGWIHYAEEERAKAVRLARRAVDIDREDVNVLWQAAFTIWTFERDGPTSRELFRRALVINQNSAIALTMAGWVEAAIGSPTEARRLIERSQRLNPRHPRGWFMATGMAIACIGEGKYEEAVGWAERALAANRTFAVALRASVVALVNVGQLDRARLVLDELTAGDPKLTVSVLQKRLTFFHQELLQIYLTAFRAVGLPE
jgi:TolB-like protein/Tfp pilus assembly protein PilF